MIEISHTVVDQKETATYSHELRPMAVVFPQISVMVLDFRMFATRGNGGFQQCHVSVSVDSRVIVRDLPESAGPHWISGSFRTAQPVHDLVRCGTFKEPETTNQAFLKFRT